MDPLETRSLPDGLWRHMPESVVELDTKAREAISAAIDPNASPWSELRWLSESPEGIALCIGVALVLVGISKRKSFHKISRAEAKKILQAFFLQIVLFGIFAALSDLTSNGLKRIFGRLKPHVNWYHPDAPLPALSFPSNHAFNTAFLCTLVLLVMGAERRARNKMLIFVLVLFVLLVGLTRILFGQHYPLDVLYGWFFGVLFGAVMAPLFRKLSKGFNKATS